MRITDKFIKDTIYDNFSYIDRETFNLPLGILIDNCGDYKWMNLPKILLIQNSYGRHVIDYFAYNLETDQIMNSHKKLNINIDDFLTVIDFVYNFKQHFIRLTEGNVKNLSNWFDLIEGKYNNYINSKLNESVSTLNEMSKLIPSLTGLPMIIWVDETRTYEKGGHWKRIKFQPNKSVNKSNEFISMTLESPHMINNKNHGYKNRDIKMLELFIDENKENLSKLSDASISLTTFTHNMIIFDENGKLKYPDNNINYKHYTNINLLFGIVVSSKNMYNIINPDGELLFDIWFNKIDMNIFKDKNNIEYVKGYIDNKIYKLYLNGRFKLIKTNY